MRESLANRELVHMRVRTIHIKDSTTILIKRNLDSDIQTLKAQATWSQDKEVIENLLFVRTRLCTSV